MTRIYNQYGNTLNGSQKFDNESTISYELGYKVKPSKKLSYDFTAFIMIIAN